MLIVAESLEDTDKLAKVFAEKVRTSGAFVCLYGEIGTGKTTFTKSVAKYLGVTENVTSPSFVILNEYHSGCIPFYHFDLYRLEMEGVKTIAAEIDEYSQENVLTLVEWAEYSNIELPQNRIEICIKYKGEHSREFDFIALGATFEIIKDIANDYSNL